MTITVLFLYISPVEAHCDCHSSKSSMGLTWYILIIVPLSVILGSFNTWLITQLNSRFRLPDDKSDCYTDGTLEKYIEKKREKFIRELSAYNGMIEILMFSCAILLNIQLFIAFWLGVKTALKWDYEKKSVPRESKIVETTDYFTTKFFYLRFLIGNALNIAMGYIIATLANRGLITF